MPESAASAPEDLPEAQVSLVLVRTGSEALIRALGRKRGERFLLAWVVILAAEDSMRNVFPIRPAAARPAEAQASREAVAWLRQQMPALIASLPPK